MESGQISRAVQASWKKAGLGQEITCTLMRKSAVSSIHQNKPEQKANLADLMCHTTQTAEKSYRLVQRQKTSVAASLALTELMRSSNPDNASAADSNLPDVQDSATAADPTPIVNCSEESSSVHQPSILPQVCYNTAFSFHTTFINLMF